jgi:hypothetical protein
MHAAVTFLQRTAGNRAVTALIQRDQAETAALDASYQRSVSTNDWRQAAKDLNGFNEADIKTRLGALSHDQLIGLDAAARHAMPGSDRLTGNIAIQDSEANRVGLLIFQYDTSIVGRDFDGACIFLNAFNENDILTMAGRLTAHDLGKLVSAAKDKNVGGGRLAQLLVAVSGGSAKIEVTEQVGGNVYGVEGGYTYRLTPEALEVNVGMNFKPDKGVTVPVGDWFGSIAKVWNAYSAVNDDDPADHKRIDFKPFQGGDHDIDVSTGTPDSRANAGHYFVRDPRIADTVPHEFGHLIGLEDEYERDVNDFRRVADQTPETGATPAATTDPIAQALHDALFLGEHHLEWHRTAERRRMAAVDAVCAAHGITPKDNWGRTPLTADVSAAYSRIFSVELSHDFMRQIDTDNAEFNDWREKVLGTFQQTSTSVMGDETYKHEHPVEPRHVRAFAGYVQKLLGRGHWSPKPHP